jgi:transcriptional regulator with XRE-family HTH domain
MTDLEHLTLAKLRLRAGLTQRQLAAVLGITFTRIGEINLGKLTKALEGQDSELSNTATLAGLFIGGANIF